jgi:hypothetical protein
VLGVRDREQARGDPGAARVGQDGPGSMAHLVVCLDQRWGGLEGSHDSECVAAIE